MPLSYRLTPPLANVTQQNARDSVNSHAHLYIAENCMRAGVSARFSHVFPELGSGDLIVFISYSRTKNFALTQAGCGGGFSAHPT